MKNNVPGQFYKSTENTRKLHSSYSWVLLISWLQNICNISEFSRSADDISLLQVITCLEKDWLIFCSYNWRIDQKFVQPYNLRYVFLWCRFFHIFSCSMYSIACFTSLYCPKIPHPWMWHQVWPSYRENHISHIMASLFQKDSLN